MPCDSPPLLLPSYFSPVFPIILFQRRFLSLSKSTSFPSSLSCISLCLLSSFLYWCSPCPTPLRAAASQHRLGFLCEPLSQEQVWASKCAARNYPKVLPPFPTIPSEDGNYLLCGAGTEQAARGAEGGSSRERGEEEEGSSCSEGLVP